jgi:O-antigen ligase
MFNKDPIFHVIGNTRIDNAVGFCGSWDISGIFIAATAPFLFSRKLWLVLIPAIGIVACRSSFSMMALILSFLFYILISHRKLLKFILPVVCILGLIFFYRDGGLNKSKFMERFEICQVVTKSILQGNINIRNSLEEDSTHIMKINSWTGVGLGNFLSIFPYYPGKYFNIRNSSTGLFNHAHNDYIEAFFEFGIIGGIILFGLILSNLFKLIISVKINKEILVYVSCLIAYLVNAAGIFASHIAVSVFLLIIIWGLSRSVLREVRSSYGTVAGLE